MDHEQTVKLCPGDAQLRYRKYKLYRYCAVTSCHTSLAPLLLLQTKTAFYQKVVFPSIAIEIRTLDTCYFDAEY